jgi:hypothetical protein
MRKAVQGNDQPIVKDISTKHKAQSNGCHHGQMDRRVKRDRTVVGSWGEGSLIVITEKFMNGDDHF